MVNKVMKIYTYSHLDDFDIYIIKFVIEVLNMHFIIYLILNSLRSNQEKFV